MGKDGTLDYGKFAALTVHLQRMDNDEHLQKAFSHFDLDGNGFIDYDELKQALVDEMDDTELIKDIMNEVDTDKVRVVGKFPSIFINSHPILCFFQLRVIAFLILVIFWMQFAHCGWPLQCLMWKYLCLMAQSYIHLSLVYIQFPFSK